MDFSKALKSVQNERHSGRRDLENAGGKLGVEGDITASAVEGAEPHARKRALAWIHELEPRERHAFVACFGGWALDGMDVQMYSFVIPTLIASWGLTLRQAGTLGTASLLASALGGWLAGFSADRFGRVRTLQLAILWYAVFTFLSGLAQSYGQLLAARALLGIGFGGEWAAGAVLLGESMRAEHRGKMLGIMQAGWSVGWAAATLLNLLLFSVMPAERAWRVLFMVGIAPALFIFYIRRYVEEPPVYLQSRAKLATSGERPSFFEIFRPPLLKTTLLGGLLGTGARAATTRSTPSCRPSCARSGISR
jgi:MFS family permease